MTQWGSLVANLLNIERWGMTVISTYFICYEVGAVYALYSEKWFIKKCKLSQIALYGTCITRVEIISDLSNSI